MASENENRYKPPYIQWYEDDFWSFRVRNMPKLARLMRRSLLQGAWHSDNPPYIPADDTMLMLLADAPSKKDWVRHRDDVVSGFEKTEDGRWYCDPQILRLYERVTADHEARVRGGQTSGRARSYKRKREDNNSSPTAEREVTNSPAEGEDEVGVNNPEARSQKLQPDTQNAEPKAQNPTTANQPLQGASARLTEGAESLYNLYPRKVAKPHALKAIAAAIERVRRARSCTSADAVAYLRERVCMFADSPAGHRGKYTPHPATWFNQGRYDDDDKEWQKQDDDSTRAKSNGSAIRKPVDQSEYSKGADHVYDNNGEA